MSPADLESESAVADGAPRALVAAELLHLGDPLLALLQHLVPLHPEVVLDHLHITHARQQLCTSPRSGTGSPAPHPEVVLDHLQITHACQQLCTSPRSGTGSPAHHSHTSTTVHITQKWYWITCRPHTHVNNCAHTSRSW